MSRPYGIAGRLAGAFIHSKLTPLIVLGSLALGILAVVALPREEEPQIIVPMIDVFVQMPGASPSEVEQRVTRPMEKLLWEVPGVEYIYSTSSPGMSMVIVRFRVGEQEEPALVRLNQKLAANLDIIPPGVSMPIVKPRSIDDVPIMGLTLWSPRYDDFQIRQVASQLHDAIKEVADVSGVEIIGGRTRQVSVEIDPARLGSYGLDPGLSAMAQPPIMCAVVGMSRRISVVMLIASPPVIAASFFANAFAWGINVGTRLPAVVSTRPNGKYQRRPRRISIWPSSACMQSRISASRAHP